MAAKKLSTWLGVLLFIVGCIVGAVAGGMVSSRLIGNTIVDNWVNNQTSYAQSHVLVLRQLRTGENEAALEMLEDQLDRDIVSLLPNRYEEFRITERTQARVEQALQAAKNYRQEFPREKTGKLIEQDVERAFSIVE